jgi:hypothetical protein
MGSCEHDNELSGSLRGRGFFGQLQISGKHGS